MATTLKSLN